MYLPIDPKKVQLGSSVVIESLCSTKHCHAVKDGVWRQDAARAMTTPDALELVARLNELNYVRVGTGKMAPVPPHFGVSLAQDRRVAHLIEYVGIECGRDRAVRDISFLAELIFLEIKELEELRVPVDCSGLTLPGIVVRVDSDKGSTFFAR